VVQNPGNIPESAVNFAEVVQAVRPIAIQECRRRARAGTNCDFQVVLDPNRRAAPNAYQSVDDEGRPILTFTASLIPAMRNTDELAFILSHEAAHHIAGHLAQKEENAEKGAAVFADLATLTGADVGDAEKLGAAVGARSYSKEFELEADELGTIITYQAGFNPLTGAQFFTRIPDPGDQFLSTHPPNAARLDVVRRTSARLGVSG
jgi:Zn-dependent protease with chaperone function